MSKTSVTNQQTGVAVAKLPTAAELKEKIIRHLYGTLGTDVNKATVHKLGGVQLVPLSMKCVRWFENDTAHSLPNKIPERFITSALNI